MKEYWLEHQKKKKKKKVRSAERDDEFTQGSFCAEKRKN